MRFSALAALGCASCRRSGAATALSAALSATVGARLSVGVAWGGADAGTRMEAFCNKMAPNTATDSTIASADAIAARRMPDLHLGGMDRVFNPTSVANSWRGQQSPLALPTHRETTVRRIVGRRGTDIIRSPASPAVARAPRAATPPRRRAWLRIFVVRCSLPCDPPVGGHSCNGRSYHAIARSATKADRQGSLNHSAMSAYCPNSGHDQAIYDARCSSGVTIGTRACTATMTLPRVSASSRLESWASRSCNPRQNSMRAATDGGVSIEPKF